jgi:hypothetical protein
MVVLILLTCLPTVLDAEWGFNPGRVLFYQIDAQPKLEEKKMSKDTLTITDNRTGRELRLMMMILG